MAETDPGPSLSANVDRTSKWVNTISHSLVPATSGRSVLRSRQVATKNREPSPSPPQELRTPVNASTDLIRYNIPEHLRAAKYDRLTNALQDTRVFTSASF